MATRIALAAGLWSRSPNPEPKQFGMAGAKNVWLWSRSLKFGFPFNRQFVGRAIYTSKYNGF